MPLTNIYVRASGGEVTVKWSPEVFVATLNITALPVPEPEVNIPPTFELPLIPKHFNFSNKENTDGTSKGFTFPAVKDSDGEAVELTITKGLTPFMRYDEKTRRLITTPSAPNEFGTFFVTI